MYDPEDRITAKKALQHDWFKEAATPDDGTEAAKIKAQRANQAMEAAQTTASHASSHTKQNPYR